MAISRQDGERTSQEPEHGTVVATPSASPPVAVAAAGSTVVRSKGSRQKDLPATPAEPRMVRIMQADGTMKMEPRYGTSKAVDASSGQGRTGREQLPGAGRTLWSTRPGKTRRALQRCKGPDRGEGQTTLHAVSALFTVNLSTILSRGYPITCQKAPR